MMKICAFLVPLALQAVTPGAWETFPTETNADGWGLYDYADETTYFPSWLDDSAAGANADPYIGGNFAADPDPPADTPTYYNQPLWFFADELVAEGAFIGDYVAAGVAGIEVDVLITNPDLLSECDITLLSNDSGTDVTYYSQFFPGSSFPSDPIDWVQLTLGFDEQWFIFDETIGDYVEAELTEEALSSVLTVGVRFFPDLESETIWSPFIDNFALTPTVVTPAITPGSGNGNFSMTFEATPANRYDLQIFNVTNEMWEDVAAQADIIPSETPYLLETSLSPGKGIFRVVPEASYEQVFTSESAPAE